MSVQNHSPAQQSLALTENEISSRLFQLADYVSLNYNELATAPKSTSSSPHAISPSDRKEHHQPRGSHLFVPSVKHGYLARSVSPNVSLVPQLDCVKVHSPVNHGLEQVLTGTAPRMPYPVLTAPVETHVHSSNLGHSMNSAAILSSSTQQNQTKRKFEIDSSVSRPIPHRLSLVLSSSSDEEGSDSGSNEQGKDCFAASSKRKRGNLPKTATDELKKWLKGHMNFPYPTEDEKHELVALTSLSLCQVNNWFINARRRLLPSLKFSTNHTAAENMQPDPHQHQHQHQHQHKHQRPSSTHHRHPTSHLPARSLH